MLGCAWMIALFISSVVAYECSNDCSPIVLDSTFDIAATSPTLSPWVTQPSNTPYITFTNDTFYTAPSELAGNILAVMQGSANISLIQNLLFPPLVPSKSYILSFYLYTDLRNALITVDGIVIPLTTSLLTVSIDGVQIASISPIQNATTFNQYSYNLTQLGFTSGNHTLALSVSGSNSEYYYIFKINNVDILTPCNDPLEHNVYVSAKSSLNDFAPDGTLSNPYCSLYAAILDTAPGYIIYVEGGAYCSHNDHSFVIKKTVSIVGLLSPDHSFPSIDLRYQWPGFVIQEATRFSISSFTLMHANNGPFFAAYNSPMLSLHNITLSGAINTATTFVQQQATAVSLSNCSAVVISGLVYDQLSYYAISAVDSTGNILQVSGDSALLLLKRSNLSVSDLHISLSTSPDDCFLTYFSVLSITQSSIATCYSTFINTEANFQSVLFTDAFGTLVSYNPFIKASFSNITISDSAISSLRNSYAFIHISENTSSVQIISTVYENSRIQQGLFAARGSIQLTNCTFANNMKGNLILARDHASITIDSCYFTNNTNALISLFGANVRVVNTSFLGYNTEGTAVPLSLTNSSGIIEGSVWYNNSVSVALIIIENSQLFISDNQFTQNQVVYGGLAAYSNSQLYFERNLFASNVGNISGAVYLTNSSTIISNSTFSENSGSTGVFWMDLGSASIYNSTFHSNIGFSEGGVVSLTGNLTLVNCTVHNNSAHYGGVFYYSPRRSSNEISSGSDYNIALDGVTIRNNTAKVAGGVLFSSFSKVPYSVVGSDIRDNFAPSGSLVATRATSMTLSSVPLPTIQSGVTTLDSFTVEMKDEYNQTVHENGFVYLKIGERNLASADIVSGVASFPATLLYGPIGDSSTYTLYTSIVSIAAKRFPVSVSLCTAGYIARDGFCDPCPDKTYGFDGRTCLECPSNAYCTGGSSVITLPGYWYNETDLPHILYKCPDKACIGNNTCAPNHEGIVCAVCSDGFYNWGAGCKACAKVNGVVVFLGVLVAIVLIIWFQKADSASGFISVVSYFIQTLLIVSDEVNFGFLNFFNFQFGGNQSTSTVFGYHLCPGPYDFYDRYYFTYATPIILVVVFLVGVVVEQLLHLLRLLKSPNRGRQRTALVKLALFMYSPITNNVFGIFFCMEISHTLLLVSNSAIQCSGSRYYAAYAVGIASLLVVVVSPISLFILLFKARNHLAKEETQRVWGALYLQFKPEYYYWSIIILLRRFVIIILALLSSQRDVRAFLLMVATLVTMVLQLNSQPFITPIDNYLESVSLVLLFIFSCFLDNGNQYTQQWVVLAVGIIFGINLVYVIMRKITDKLRGKFKFSRILRRRKNSSSTSASVSIEMNPL